MAGVCNFLWCQKLVSNPELFYNLFTIAIAAQLNYCFTRLTYHLSQHAQATTFSRPVYSISNG